MTAHALIFFTDYAVNNSFVESSLISGLQTYLIARRTGKGSFTQSFPSSNSLVVPQYTHDAFVLYALAYSNSSANLTVESTSLKVIADNQYSSGKVDTYFVSVLANALYKLKSTANAQVLADYLVKLQNSDGSITTTLPATATANGANGTEYTLQATALSVLAW
jgi:hypothetical protein